MADLLERELKNKKDKINLGDTIAGEPPGFPPAKGEKL